MCFNCTITLDTCLLFVFYCYIVTSPATQLHYHLPISFALFFFMITVGVFFFLYFCCVFFNFNFSCFYSIFLFPGVVKLHCVWPFRATVQSPLTWQQTKQIFMCKTLSLWKCTENNHASISYTWPYQGQGELLEPMPVTQVQEVGHTVGKKCMERTHADTERKPCRHGGFKPRTVGQQC